MPFKIAVDQKCDRKHFIYLEERVKSKSKLRERKKWEGRSRRAAWTVY